MESLKLSELERTDQEPKIQTESQISPNTWKTPKMCLYKNN